MKLDKSSTEELTASTTSESSGVHKSKWYAQKIWTKTD